MHFDPDPGQDTVGRVLRSAHEGVARSVVAQDQSGTAANRIEGLIQTQGISTATFFATNSGGLVPLPTGAVFTAAFGTLSSCVSCRAGTAAVEHLHVQDVSVVENSRKFGFAGDWQA